MHGLRDAPGDRTIGRHADDESALAAQKAHVKPLANENDEAGILPASPGIRGNSGQSRRTLTVRRWPGRNVDWRLMPFQLTRSLTVTPNTCAMRESVSPLRTL